MTASLAIAMLAHAIQRRLARGTTDVEIAALVERFQRDCDVVFTVETLEYLQRGGRIGTARRPRRLAPQRRPILERRGRRGRRGRARAREGEGARRVRAPLRRSATEDRPGLRVAIAHADAPEWVGTLSELVWRVRPKAEIEFTATLGAVVSTHTGPGAVGFFWFQDG